MSENYLSGTSDRGGSSKNKKTTPYMPPGWETALPYPSVVFTMEEGEDRYPPSRLHWTEEDDREVKKCVSSINCVHLEALFILSAGHGVLFGRCPIGPAG